jgi:hypothetical protein
MQKGTFGAVGLIVEIAGLSAGWLIYQTGLGAGPQGVVPMLFGVAIAGIGLLAGGALGVLTLVKEEKMPLLAIIAIILPLGIVTLLIAGKMFPL